MNKTLLGIFAVALCFTVAHTLQCYKCDIGFWGVCITSKVTCNSGELCFSGVGKAIGFVKLESKGCLALGLCNQTSDVSFNVGSNPTIYNMTKTCCSTDLCNASPGLSLHTITLTLTSVLLAKLLL